MYPCVFRILGVIVAVNKTKNDEFTARDEAHFTSFCEFCSLVVSNCQAKREINKTKLKYQVNSCHLVPACLLHAQHLALIIMVGEQGSA